AAVVLGGEAHGGDDRGQQLVVGVLGGVADHAAAGLERAAGVADQHEGDRVDLVAGAVLLAVADGDDGVVEDAAAPLHGLVELLAQARDLTVEVVVDLDLVGGAATAAVGHGVVVAIDAQEGERVPVAAAVVVGLERGDAG